ncbi:hypothetical protein ACOSQ3_012787 [Xanthoceras sorbifolium]
MPSINEYRENRDPVKHISRFTTLMGTQTRDDRLLCQAFPITFGDLAGSWFRQLPPHSIDNFEQFSRAFSQQFMGSVQRKKSLSHMSSVKQGRGESIRAYLSRFNREVIQVEDFNDSAVINIFTNGLQNGAFSFQLRKQWPKTYLEMVEVAADYEEEEIAQGGHLVHGVRPNEPDHSRTHPNKGDNDRFKGRGLRKDSREVRTGCEKSKGRKEDSTDTLP